MSMVDERAPLQGFECGHAQPQGFASCTLTRGHHGRHRCEGTPWQWNAIETRCPMAYETGSRQTFQCALPFSHPGNHHAAGWEWQTEAVIAWSRPDTSAEVKTRDRPAVVVNP
jgi:hypothetical protein